MAVFRAWRAAGGRACRVSAHGRAACCRADVPEVPADPGGREPAGRAGPLPGQPRIGGQRPGQAELVTAPVLRRQRQSGQVPDRAVRAQHRVSQLAQLISAGGQARVEISPEPRQRGERPGTGGIIWQAVHHGLGGDHGPLTRTHDHAETLLMSCDMPDNTGKTPDQKPQRVGWPGASQPRATRPPSACGFLLRVVSLDGLADVVAGGRMAVLAARRAAAAGFAGFRRAGGTRHCRVDAAEPAADPGGGRATAGYRRRG